MAAGALVGKVGLQPAKPLTQFVNGKPVRHVATTTAAAPGSTTSTTYTLTDRDYRVGSCVTWDVAQRASSYRPASDVPCSEPHVIEMTGTITITGFSKYPTEPEWDEYIADHCKPSVERRLGGPIDPDGRFRVSALTPTDKGWAMGDRKVQCGIEALMDHAPAFPGQKELFRGKAEGQPQARVEPPGTCEADANPWPVPCSEAHIVEVTGSVDLTGLVANAPASTDTKAWQALVGPACQAAARNYLGRPLRGDERAGWQPIRAASWEAGRRVAECTVGRMSGDERVAVTGLLKST